MTQTFPAIYEDGVLKPLTPLALSEHERVWVHVSPQIAREQDEAAIIAKQRRAAEELDALMAELPDSNPEASESFYDAAVRLGVLGTLKGSPADLSTNKKYFEGFGKSAS